jgi:hypothetical protein
LVVIVHQKVMMPEVDQVLAAEAAALENQVLMVLGLVILLLVKEEMV